MRGRLTLERTIELLCSAPARFLGFEQCKGTLDVGKDADFALVNLWCEDSISADTMHSKGKYTPFQGMTLKAKVERTWLHGTAVISESGKRGELQLRRNCFA